MGLASNINNLLIVSVITCSNNTVPLVTSFTVPAAINPQYIVFLHWLFLALYSAKTPLGNAQARTAYD